jgi:hypothetical protein
MPRVGFESMIPVFDRAKTVRAFDRAATVIGRSPYTDRNVPVAPGGWGDKNAKALPNDV